MLKINTHRLHPVTLTLDGAEIEVTYRLMGSAEMLARRAVLTQRGPAIQAAAAAEDAPQALEQISAEYLADDVAWLSSHIVDLAGLVDANGAPLDWAGDLDGHPVRDLVLDIEPIRLALTENLWLASRGEPGKNS